VAKKAKKEEKLTEAKLIELLDEEKIGYLDFIEELQKVNKRKKSEIYGYWLLIRRTLNQERTKSSTSFVESWRSL
jgi:hypothetical protein